MDDWTWSEYAQTPEDIHDLARNWRQWLEDIDDVNVISSSVSFRPHESLIVEMRGTIVFRDEGDLSDRARILNDHIHLDDHVIEGGVVFIPKVMLKLFSSHYQMRHFLVSSDSPCIIESYDRRGRDS